MESILFMGMEYSFKVVLEATESSLWRVLGWEGCSSEDDWALRDGGGAASFKVDSGLV